jgi:signal transduction histidine kinase
MSVAMPRRRGSKSVRTRSTGSQPPGRLLRNAKSSTSVAWTFWITCAALILVAIVLSASAGIPTRFAPKPVDALVTALILLFAAMGALVAGRRPRNPIGWILCVAALGWSIAKLAAAYTVYGRYVHQGNLPGLSWSAWASSWIWAPGLVLAVTFLFLLFPDGRLPSRRWRPMAWLAGAAGAGVLLGSALAPGSMGPLHDQANPIAVSDNAVLEALAKYGWLALAGSAFGCVASIVVRYRRSAGDERQQLKWFGGGACLAAVSLMTVTVLGRSAGEAGNIVLLSGLAFLSVAAGIAILKYRLYQIDLILGRSVIYGASWLIIGASFVGVAAATGIEAGRRLPIGLAVLLTIAATLIFEPARRRLNQLSSRLVFGERATRFELLSRFGRTLEHAFDLDELCSEIARAARQGLSVEWARLWLVSDLGGVRPAAGSGVHLDEERNCQIVVPLGHAELLLGAVECGPKRSGTLTEEDFALLTTLGGQAALAIHNVRLTEELSRRLADIQQQATELAASRGRIVAAQQAERRRIERNIHDGAQQHIVALNAKLGLARTLVRTDTGRVDAILRELHDDVRGILTELRELAQGIHPPLLADKGLLEAIEARSARIPLGVSIEASTSMRGARYPEEIEAAAYFVVSESLTNVLKHAAVNRASVRLSAGPKNLTVQVTDDGVGLSANVRGSGLTGLKDRIEAVGGTFQVESQPGRGTAVTCVLPVPQLVAHGE